MKIADKLSKINDRIEISMFDNGFVVEVNGYAVENDDYKTAKIIANDVEALLALISEAATMERT